MDTAKNWITAWHSKTEAQQGAIISQLKAMMIPEDDLAALRAETGADGIRVYFGYGADPSVTGDDERFRFVVVAVKKKLVKGVEEFKDLFVGDPPIEGVYDFCLPCPNTCDQGSPLYGAA